MEIKPSDPGGSTRCVCVCVGAYENKLFFLHISLYYACHTWAVSVQCVFNLIDVTAALFFVSVSDVYVIHSSSVYVCLCGFCVLVRVCVCVLAG